MQFFKYIFIFSFVFFSFFSIKAQKSEYSVDSLLTVVEEKSDSAKMNALLELSKYFTEKHSDSALIFVKKLLVEAKNASNESFEADAFNVMGYIAFAEENYAKSIELLKKALKIREVLDENKKRSNTLNLMGTVYHRIGNLEKALEYYQLALEVAEIDNDIEYLNSPISNIGVLYGDMGEYELAKEYELKALSLAKESKSKLEMAKAYNNLGTTFQETGHLDTAKLFYKEALRLYNEVNYHSGAAHIYNNMAIISFMEGDLDESLSDFRKAKDMRLASKDMVSYSQSLMNVGIYYQLVGNYDSAIVYADTSLLVAQKYGALGEQKDAYLVMAECYDSIRDYNYALRNFQKFVKIKDSIMDESSMKHIQEMETKYQTKQQQKELELKDLKIKKEEEEKQYAASRKRSQFLMIGIAGAGMLFVLVLITRGNIARKKANVKLAEINNELETQKDIIEEKNKDITDSILYAQKIQEAMLHSGTDIKSVFQDSFILYKPKDIVAGDFYWWVKEKNRCYLAAADCTGHGVPGAMVSVACANILNKTVNQLGLSKPSEILDKSAELVTKAFSVNEGKNSYIKDGMDIALCAFDINEKDTVEIEYAGANNPLWIIRKDGSFEEVRANRQPIGYFEYRKPFTNTTITLEKGDTIYLFSDGYVDQFGGAKNKKYKSANFKKKLLSIQGKLLEEQKNILEAEFIDWKGAFEQTDDVCVIGVRI